MVKLMRRFLVAWLVGLLLPMLCFAGANQWSGTGPVLTGEAGSRMINALWLGSDGFTLFAGTGSGMVFAYSSVYTVNFQSNGGSLVGSQSVAANGNAITPNPAPTKAGYAFGGWYADAGLTSLFNFGTAIVSSLTLYAAWVPTYSAPAAVGSGNIVASFAGGGGGGMFVSAQYLGSPPGVAPVPPTVPPVVPAIVFPYGLFQFTASGFTPGGTLNFTLTYPQPLPAGTQYWKYGPTASNNAPHWYVIPATINGNTIMFSITDGGLGDDDLSALNGSITDAGGPGYPGSSPTTIPTLSALGLLLLSMAAGLLGLGFSRPTVPNHYKFTSAPFSAAALIASVTRRLFRPSRAVTSGSASPRMTATKWAI